MLNGKIAQWQKLQVTLGMNGAGSSTLQSLWTPNAVNVCFFEMAITANAANGNWQAAIVENDTGMIGAPIAGYLNLPSGGIQLSGSGNSVTIDMVFNNWRLYGVNPNQENYLFHVFWDSLQIFLNGSLLYTIAGNDVVSQALGPTWVPIFSGLVDIEGGINSNSGQVGSCVISGGWRFMVNNVWYAPPIAVPPISTEAPTTGYGHNVITGAQTGPWTAPFGLHVPDALPGTSTFGTQITSSGYYNGPGDEGIIGGGIVLIPNLPKGIQRMNTDYGATFAAYSVPNCIGSSIRNWVIPPTMFPTNTPSAGSSSQAVVISHVPFSTQEVGSVAGTLEAFFANPSYSMVSMSEIKEIPSGVSIELETIEYTYPVTMDAHPSLAAYNIMWAYNYDSQLPAYLAHADFRCNYFNSCLIHPGWTTGLYTGPWTLEGSPTTWENYWGPIREQYMSAQQRRNSLYGEPCEESGWTAFLDNYFTSPTGKGMRWIGVSRFQTQAVTPPTTYQLDSTSQSNWTPDTSCSLIFQGNQFTIIPNAKPSVCNFTISLLQTPGSFNAEPWSIAALAMGLFTNWDPSSSNISQVIISALFEGGDTQSLINVGDTSTKYATNYYFTRNLSGKFAGSYGINNGFGVVNDQGIDIASGGISALIMNDPALVDAFGLMTEAQPVALKFAVTLSDNTKSATMQYPTLLMPDPTNNPKSVIVENGQVAACIYKNGPGIRLGNHVWDDGTFFYNPPLISSLGNKWSVVDWLCDKRVHLYGVGPTAALTNGGPNLTTELTQLYDSYEGQSPNIVALDTIAFLLPPNSLIPGESPYRAALVNTWSEVPPLAGYPYFARNADWSTNQGLTNVSWSWCVVPRRIVSPTSIDLYNPAGVKQTIPSPLAIAGWPITEFTSTVQNNESPNWTLVSSSDGKVWAEVTPWHGYFFIAGSLAFSIAICCWPEAAVYFIVQSTSSGLYLNRVDFKGLDDKQTIAIGSGYGISQITWAPGNRLVVTYSQNGSVYRITNSALGNDPSTWSAPMLIATGSANACAMDQAHRCVELFAVCNAGSWSLYSLGMSDTSPQYVAPIVNTVSNSVGGLTAGPSGEYVFTYYDGSQVQRLYSSNRGMTWSNL